MKWNKKIVASACAGAVAAAVLAAVIVRACTRPSPGTLTVGLYGLTEREKDAVGNVLAVLNGELDSPYTIEYDELDGDKPLSSQVRFRGKERHDVVLLHSGLQADSLSASIPQHVKKPVYFEAEAASSYPSSLRAKAGKADGRIVQLPLAQDHFEVDIERSMLSAAGMRTIASWDDIELFAMRARLFMEAPEAPIVFAGRDDGTLISTVGALTESMASAGKAEEAQSALLAVAQESPKNREQRYLAAVHELSDEPSAPLYAATHAIARWISNRTAHQELLNLTQADVQNLIEAGKAAVVLMPLSNHRSVKAQDMDRYATIYYPSARAAETRAFTGSTLMAVPLFTQEDKAAFVSRLCAPSAQEPLARLSGLIPADAACRTADRQADEARLWIASTNAPLTPLSDAVCPDEESKAALAKAIRSYIRGLY